MRYELEPGYRSRPGTLRPYPPRIRAANGVRRSVTPGKPLRGSAAPANHFLRRETQPSLFAPGAVPVSQTLHLFLSGGQGERALDAPALLTGQIPAERCG